MANNYAIRPVNKSGLVGGGRAGPTGLEWWWEAC